MITIFKKLLPQVAVKYSWTWDFLFQQQIFLHICPIKYAVVNPASLKDMVSSNVVTKPFIGKIKQLAILRGWLPYLYLFFLLCHRHHLMLTGHLTFHCLSNSFYYHLCCNGTFDFWCITIGYTYTLHNDSHNCILQAGNIFICYFNFYTALHPIGSQGSATQDRIMHNNAVV